MKQINFAFIILLSLAFYLSLLSVFVVCRFIDFLSFSLLRPSFLFAPSLSV
jgi:hypothetical protein